MVAATAFSSLLLMAGSASAQAASATTSASAGDVKLRAMTLAEATSYAREHQPVVQLAKARIAAAKATAAIPGALWLPQLGGMAQLVFGSANNTTAMYTADASIDIPRIGGTPTTSTGTFKPYASTLVGLGINQELFDFGRIDAQSVALESFVDVERFRAVAGRLDLDLAVQEAFYAVQGAKAVVDAADAAYLRAKAHRDLAKAAVEQDLRAPVELARAEADLARFEVGRVRALGGLTLARTVFAAAAGVPDTLLDAAGEPSALPPLPPLDKAIADATARDPMVQLALAEVKAQENNTKAIAAETRPNIFLTATLSGRAGGAPASTAGVGTPTGSGLLPVIPNWDIGVVLSWPLYDGVVDAREKASKAKEEALRVEIDVQKTAEIAEIRQAYFAVQVALANLPALERALDAARITYKQTDARFKGGIATSVELADAEALLTSAEIELAQGRFEVAKARAVFARVTAEGL